jgi:hypothetical protein
MRKGRVSRVAICVLRVEIRKRSLKVQLRTRPSLVKEGEPKWWIDAKRFVRLQHGFKVRKKPSILALLPVS